MIKSIAGDIGDNIVGLSGIGEKTAIKILQIKPNLLDLQRNKPKVKSIRGCKDFFKSKNIQQIKFNKRLVKIPNSEKDIDKLVDQEIIKNKQVNRIRKSILNKIYVEKKMLSRIFDRYRLRKFKTELIIGKKDFGKLLGIELL